VIDQQITPPIVSISESVLIPSRFTFLILIQPVATLSAGIFVAAVLIVFFKLISRKVHGLGAKRLEPNGSRALLNNGSIRGNICMGSPNKDFSEDLMNKILRMADLDGVIQSLPSDLESMLEEGASNASGAETKDWNCKNTCTISNTAGNR
jgi:hypothetical protein